MIPTIIVSIKICCWVIIISRRAGIIIHDLPGIFHEQIIIPNTETGIANRV